MIFRRLCLKNKTYTDSHLTKLTKILIKQCKLNNGPLSDVAERALAEK